MGRDYPFGNPLRFFLHPFHGCDDFGPSPRFLTPNPPETGRPKRSDKDNAKRKAARLARKRNRR